MPLLVCVVLTASVVPAAAAPISNVSTPERGNVLTLSLGARHKSRSVRVETGIQKKGKWRYALLATVRTDAKGRATVCGSRTLTAGMTVRARSSGKVVATVRNRKSFVLSGCGWSPPVAPEVTTSVPPVGEQRSAGGADTSTSPGTVPATTTTTTTTAPPVTTTVVPLPPPSALALTAATDSGVSNNDGITKAAAIGLRGTAPAGSGVQAFVDGVSTGPACTADGSGTFSCSVGAVPEGVHVLTAVAVLGARTSSASTGYTVRVDRTAPMASLTSPYAAVGDYGSMTVTVSLSEASQDMTSADVSMVCSDPGTCSVSGFSGSGSNYAFTYTHTAHTSAGSALSVAAGAFSDAAGNLSTALARLDIGLDDQPPVIDSIVWNGTSLEIAFNEAVTWSALWDAAFEDWPGGSFSSRHLDGANISGLRNPSGDKMNWLVDVSNPMDDWLDVPVQRANTYFDVGISVTDVWGRPIQNSRAPIT